MSRFWATIVLVFVGLFLFLQAGAALLLPPRSYGDDAARRLIALEAVYLALTRVMHPWGF